MRVHHTQTPWGTVLMGLSYYLTPTCWAVLPCNLYPVPCTLYPVPRTRYPVPPTPAGLQVLWDPKQLANIAQHDFLV